MRFMKILADAGYPDGFHEISLLSISLGFQAIHLIAHTGIRKVSPQFSDRVPGLYLQLFSALVN